MKTKIIQGLVVVLLALAGWLLVIRSWGASVAGSWPMLLTVLEIALLIWLAAWALSEAVRRLGARVWLVTGLLVLAALALPAYTVSQPVLERLPAGLAALVTFYPSLIISLALVTAALLLAAGLRLVSENGRARPQPEPGARKPLPRAALACLVLSAVLFGKALHYLYWLTVWDTTYDPLGYIWIALPLLAALFSGVLLSESLAGRVRLAGLGYALVVPALMIAVSARGQVVDFRQLTLARAERTRQAIEAYYSRAGQYPQALDDLVPRYVLSVPGPIIIAGQDWCYDAGPEYYRLGYVYRAHWSDPRLVERLYASGGPAPAQPGVCAAEITAIRQSDPGYYGLGATERRPRRA